MTVLESSEVVSVKSWPEASKVLTDHERRLTAAENVTSPIGKVWAALKWGWIPGAVLLVTGADPASPLGRFLSYLTTAP
jgi:hypothetical protein